MLNLSTFLQISFDKENDLVYNKYQLRGHKMNSLKQQLLKLKLNLLKSLDNSIKEKSPIEKIMLRRHEAPKEENAALLIVKRKVK